MFSHQAKSIFDQFVPQIGARPLPELLSGILSEIARMLRVERVGYSRMEHDRSAIQQDVQYYLGAHRTETEGLPRLHAKDYPGYFKALNTPPGLVVANDVLRDTRLAEFRDSYFKPLKIASMLDVPVHRAGQLYGVICHEHVGTKREWTEAEIDAARSVAHLVALAVETDERQKAQEALRVSLEREKEIVELKTNIVALVSHEFRTPLGVIISAAEILENYLERMSSEQRRGHLQDIRYSAQQISSLMDEVLLLGKVDSGQMVCRREPLLIEDVCQRVVEEQRAASGNKCPVELKLAGALQNATGDSDLVRHILANLISNAIKFSPEASPVRVTVSRELRDAVLEVSDKGIGIEEADRERLFAAFQRGRNVGTAPGPGLGLVIVKHCVELHGGTLTFSSCPNAGTVFTVRIPLFAEESSKGNRHKPKK